MLFQERTGELEPWWVAQCLEHDIAAQAATLDELKTRLEHTVLAHAAIAADLQRDKFHNIGPAPQRFFDMWEQAK